MIRCGSMWGWVGWCDVRWDYLILWRQHLHVKSLTICKQFTILLFWWFAVGYVCLLLICAWLEEKIFIIFFFRSSELAPNFDNFGWLNSWDFLLSFHVNKMQYQLHFWQFFVLEKLVLGSDGEVKSPGGSYGMEKIFPINDSPMRTPLGPQGLSNVEWGRKLNFGRMGEVQELQR